MQTRSVAMRKFVVLIKVAGNLEGFILPLKLRQNLRFEEKPQRE